MSGHIMRFNPQAKTYVRQGQDGRFAPKIIGTTSRAELQVNVYPAPNQTKTVLTNRQGQ
ncbi:MAG TPA: hypothetical protein VIK69_02950 [Methylophilaceae bacterium]